jgi:hypothetical protein
MHGVNFPEKLSLKKLPLKKLKFFRPAQTKKKEKIGTIFCPKGGLAVVFTAHN